MIRLAHLLSPRLLWYAELLSMAISPKPLQLTALGKGKFQFILHFLEMIPRSERLVDAQLISKRYWFFTISVSHSRSSFDCACSPRHPCTEDLIWKYSNQLEISALQLLSEIIDSWVTISLNLNKLLLFHIWKSILLLPFILSVNDSGRDGLRCSNLLYWCQIFSKAFYYSRVIHIVGCL